MRPDWEPSEHFDQWLGCFNCGHYRYNKCAAYPERIPLSILSGEVDHMVRRPGQVGDILFESMNFEEWRRTGRRVPIVAPTEARTPA